MAEDELHERRTRAKEELEKRERNIKENYPEIVRINDRLAHAIKDISEAMNKKNVVESINRIAEENLQAQTEREALLEAFGLGRDYLSPKHYCEKCRDTGFVNGMRCECFEALIKKYAIKELNENCRIKLIRFEDFSLEWYDPSCREVMRKNLEMCKAYADGFSRSSDSLFFFGGTGLGKTHLSSAIAERLLSRGVLVAYDSVSNYLRRLENERFGRSSDNTMDLLLSADLVILDDLGSEYKSSFNDSAVYDILNSRINYSLPTIISTNLSFKELGSRYNERIFSRLGGAFIPVEFVGKDIRLTKRMSGRA